MIKEIIHCDKCNSDNVLHERKRGPVQENHRTMTEVIEQTKKYNMVNAVYHYQHWILLCKDCGHRLEYYV
jgi:DNA-directed RNA polymerase subunit M/transcription elongation factor TFIIS